MRRANSPFWVIDVCKCGHTMMGDHYNSLSYTGIEERWDYVCRECRCKKGQTDNLKTVVATREFNRK